MWQHEIIEYLSKFDKTSEALHIIKLLDDSHTFFLGDIHGLSSMEKIAGKTNQAWFYEGASVNRLPFPVTCFEYFDVLDGDLPSLFKAQNPDGDKVFLDMIRRTGNKGKCVLIAQQTRDNIILCESLTFNNFENKWKIFPTIIAIKIGSLWKHGEIATENGPIEHNGERGNVSLLFRNNVEGIMMQRFCDPSTLMAFDVPRLAVFLMLLNCKNISAETIEPPQKVNKKRIKNGKLPLYSYKVLNISPLSSKRRREGDSSETLSHNRVHFCRGHFKQYFPNNPLFGKFTGLYWWQPHLRGQNKDGFVDKDYNVITEDARAGQGECPGTGASQLSIL